MCFAHIARRILKLQSISFITDCLNAALFDFDKGDIFMKKILCLLLSAIIGFSLVACSNASSNSSSEEQEASITDKSVQPSEQSIPSREPSDEPSEAVSEEASEPVSEDVSRDEPQPSIDPEDFQYRRFSAHSAAELVNKLKEANEKINGDKASDFNMKDIDYLAPLSGILAQGFIFNPSVDGIYAENDPEEPHGKIEMVFDGDQSVTAIYYCRNDDDVRVMLQITYPNESMNQLISQYGVDGYCMYVSKSDRPISQMTDQEKETAGIGFRNGILGNIVIDDRSYETFKFPSGDGENNLILICDGMPILIEYYYKSDELKATHDVDDILDTIKLEKLYFDETK